MKPADLKQFPLFQDLLDDELDLLCSLLEEQQLTPGRRILRQGEEAESLVLVAEGAVSFETEEGDEATLEAPLSFGASSLVASGPRLATVTTSTPSRVATLSRTAFHRFADDAPRGAVRVLESLVTDMAGLLRQSLDHTVDRIEGEN